MALHLFVLRAAIALLLGFLIGTERQWRQRHAGIRTYSLVALGASMFVMLAILSGDYTVLHRTSRCEKDRALGAVGIHHLAGARNPLAEGGRNEN